MSCLSENCLQSSKWLGPLDGTVIHFEEPEFSEATGRKLHKVDIKKAGHFSSSTNGLDIVTMDFSGNICKTKFWKKNTYYT